MRSVAALVAFVIACSMRSSLASRNPPVITATDSCRQQGRKSHRAKNLGCSSSDSLFPNALNSDSTYAASKHHDNATRWLLLAANPRLVSFFGNPRFQHFSSGRHVINIASMQFKNLFPKSTKRESIVGGDGKLHLVLVSTLLATLVPQTSQNFAVMKKKAAHHSAPFADLWRATHDPSSVNMVGMMEILQACSYS